MTIFLALAIWIISSIAVGVAAHIRYRSYLGWLMVALLVSPLAALLVLLLISSSAMAKDADDEDNPYAVGATRHGAYAQKPMQPTTVVVQEIETSTGSAYPRMLAGFVVLAFALLAPGVWISTSLGASTDVRSTAATYDLSQDIADLAWEAPSSFPLSGSKLGDQARNADALASALIPTPTPAPAYEGGIVSHIANLRASPTTDSAITGLLDQGASVQLMAQSKDGDWYQLASGDWIAAFLVTRTGDLGHPMTTMTAACSQCASMEAGLAMVNVTQANLRSGPGAEFGIVGTLDSGQTPELAGVSNGGDWYRLADGRWIYAELVSDAPQNLVIVVEAATQL